MHSQFGKPARQGDLTGAGMDKNTPQRIPTVKLMCVMSGRYLECPLGRGRDYDTISHLQCIVAPPLEITAIQLP
jgi:hypothetical protein